MAKIFKGGEEVFDNIDVVKRYFRSIARTHFAPFEGGGHQGENLGGGEK
jgi:hypothetical protein